MRLRNLSCKAQKQFLLALYFILGGLPTAADAQKISRPKNPPRSALAVIKEFESAYRKHQQTLNNSEETLREKFEAAIKKERDELVNQLGKLQDAAFEARDREGVNKLAAAIAHYDGLSHKKQANRKVNKKHKEATSEKRISQNSAFFDLNTFAKFEFVGQADLKPLGIGDSIYTNRDYEWEAIPVSLKGWQFTTHKMRASPVYKINVTKPGRVVICFEVVRDSVRDKDLFLRGWNRVPVPPSDLKGHGWPYFIAEKYCDKGIYEIPNVVTVSEGHGNKGGAIVLVPLLKN